MSDDNITTLKRTQDATKLLIDAASRGDMNVVQTLLAESNTYTDGKIGGRTALLHAVASGKTEIVQLLVDRGADITVRDGEGRSSLTYAAARGKIDIVQCLVDRGAGVIDKDNDARSALLYAAKAGHINVVQFLVDHGAGAESDRGGRSALSYAAEAGHTEIVQLLVNHGADVTQKDEHGTSPLTYAAARGRIEIVKLLVDSGAVVSELDYDGRCPLSHSAERGNEDIGQLLIDRGADVTQKDDKRRSPLSYAAEAGHAATVQLLVDLGANMADEDDRGRSPLLYAADEDHADIVQLLVDLGADVNEKNNHGRYPVSYAAQWGKSEIVKLLVNLGANFAEKDDHGRSALVYAAKAGKVESAQLLIDFGADVLEKDSDGGSPLSYAAAAGKADMVRLLLNVGADATAKNKIGRGALSYASIRGRACIVQLLIDRGADVSEKDGDGKTPLSLAAGEGNTDIVQLLLDSGADLAARDNEGRSPLMCAASRGETEIVQLLADRGAGVTEKDNDQRSPLSYAAESGHTETVKLLIDLGADVTEKNKCGTNLLSCAVVWGDAEIVQLLIDRGADFTEKDDDGRSPLSYAIEAGDTEIVQLLVNLGADVAEKNKYGRSLLSCAAVWGDAEIVRLLIGRGADFTEKDDDGRSPLSYAAESDSTDIVTLLIAKGTVVDDKDAHERTSLSYAAQQGYSEVVSMLLEAGASPNGTMVWNESLSVCETSLTLAGRAGHMNIFKALIEAGAFVDIRAPDGETPLISISRWNYTPGVQILIDKCTSEMESLTSQSITRTPLLPDTLKTMQELCTETHEFADMTARVVQRLRDVYTHLEQHDVIEVQSEAHTTLIPVLFRFCRLLLRCEGQVQALARFVSCFVITSAIRDFHEELDHLAALLNLSLQESDWKAQWVNDETNSLQAIYEKLADDDALVDGLDNEDEKYHAAVLLVNAWKKQRGTNPVAADAIEDVKIRFLRVCDMEEPSVPDWFIAREDVEFNEWNQTEENAAITTYEGKWLKTKVIVATSTMQIDEFQNVAEQWYLLSHPNVQKLFGACHIESKPFFVYEHGKPLLDVVVGKQQSLWKYLYEAALSVQYLHQRGIIHGDLRCSNIVVGVDDVAKIVGLEAQRAHQFDSSSFADQEDWVSPELFSSQIKSFSSDIYAFGMCILEATKLKRPWFPLEVYWIHAEVKRGKLPDCPESLGDDQWDLIQKMCAFKVANRVPIAYAVHQLKRFSTARTELSSTINDQLTEPSMFVSIEKHKFPELELLTIPDKLQTIRDRCQRLLESKWLIRDVCPALEFLFQQLLSQQKQSTDSVVERYCAALRSLDRYLRTAVSEESIAHAARSRQIAETHHVIYEELDHLLDLLHVSKSDPIRSWKHNQASIDRHILEEADRVKASAVPGAVSLKSFGLSSAELSGVRNGDEPKAAPAWFLPLRKLRFSSTDEIGQGAFGKVFKGVWLDTPVVVKFMGYKGDRDMISNELFLHEVRVWHRLKKHPHIVELYGACHVDKRYFVCEYASNGDLCDYLKRDGNEHLVWEKLYEVALGLAYMHGMNVVHNDLKCDNVLVGMDEKAKLIDFGLSAIVNDAEIMVHVKNMGAVHWKSPEYLAGGRPSFASDVYSFAMCILEAVTGDIPWGSSMLSAMVKFRVKKGNIPTRPGVMNDKQWNLIELMTNQDPSERVKIAFVVDKLFEISEAEKSAIPAPVGLL